MRKSFSRHTFMASVLGLLVCGFSSVAQAQSLRGGEIKFAAVASGEERTSQSDLWVMDFYFKPMRMIPVELTDPKTKEKKLEFVWYIVYRGFHHKLETKGTQNQPENTLDAAVAPQQFIPEARLVLTDRNKSTVYHDQVIPEALAAINKREKGNYKDTVSIVGPIPDVAEEPGSVEDIPVEGVFMWKGINPDAMHYSVFLTGFSNGIRLINGPDGKPIVQTKTIMQKYWRRGDRFDQREWEIILDGDTQWIYR